MISAIALDPDWGAKSKVTAFAPQFFHRIGNCPIF